MKDHSINKWSYSRQRFEGKICLEWPNLSLERGEDHLYIDPTVRELWRFWKFSVDAVRENQQKIIHAERRAISQRFWDEQIQTQMEGLSYNEISII